MRKLSGKVRKWLMKVFGIPEDIETRIGILVEENRKLRTRVEALEQFLEPVKGYIKSTPMREDIERKKRMLRGYPDQPMKKRDE